MRLRRQHHRCSLFLRRRQCPQRPQGQGSVFLFMHEARRQMGIGIDTSTAKIRGLFFRLLEYTR